jgi:hypothetical protein
LLSRARAECFTDCLVVHTMVQSTQPGDEAEAHTMSDASVGNGSVPESASGLELWDTGGDDCQASGGVLREDRETSFNHDGLGQL